LPTGTHRMYPDPVSQYPGDPNALPPNPAFASSDTEQSVIWNFLSKYSKGSVPPPPPPPPPPPTTRSPYPGPNPASLPGKVEVENYDNGGQNLAYFDTTPGNTGGAYRSDDVDIEPTADTGGGYDVGWTQAGEWLLYSVNVTNAGTYDLQ